MDAQTLGRALAELPVGALGCLDLIAGRLRSHRHVADDLAVGTHRRRIGQHPVVIAVLAAVLDQPGPRLAVLERRPEIGERLHRHVRVAHDVLRRPDQLGFGKAADVDEVAVDVLDDTLEIGVRHDHRVFAEHLLDARHRHVHTHGCCSSICVAVTARSRAGDGGEEPVFRRSIWLR
jgi:hypothetical protein